MQKVYKVYTMLRSASLQDVLILGPRRHRVCVRLYTSFILGVFLASFFDEKIKDPYKDVRSAALEVVANNWKSIYSAEICCFQIFHRFATKYLKAGQC